MTSPTNEQQRVDVLAVLADAALTLSKVAQIQMDERAEEMRQARVAVAELIEALSECVIDMEATEEFYGNHPRAQEVIAKAKAALANVGSQP